MMANRYLNNSLLSNLSLTNLLIILNVIIFILVNLFFISGFDLSFLTLTPNYLFKGYVWQLITSMFIHFSFGHLLANMISLFFIGNFVEKLIGRKRFFWLYLLSGLFAGFFYASLSWLFGNYIWGSKLFLDPSISAVGASGAIFSLLGLLSLLTPNNKVYLISGPLIAIIIYSILDVLPIEPAILGVLSIFLNIYIIVAIFSMFSFNSGWRRIGVPVEMPFWILPFVAIIPLVLIGLFVDLPIGNMAHLGGLLVGVGYAFYLRKKYKRKTALIRRYFAR